MNYDQKIIELSKLTKQLNIAPFSQSFRWCNNNCSFCYLKNIMRKEPPSVQYMHKVSNNVINWLNDNIKNIPTDIVISLNLIGGELFCLGDEYYNEYYFLIDNIQQIIKKHKLQIKLFTNLLYNTDRLITMYKKYDNIGVVVTSFDNVGRFDNSYEIWYNNVQKLLNNDIHVDIETVLTKQFINDYLQNTNIYNYKELLKDKRIIFGHNVLVPITQEQFDNIPEHDDIVKFYCNIIDEYKGNLPNIELLNYYDTEGEESLFTDCAILQFTDDGIKEFYCNDMHNLTSIHSTERDIYKKESINNEFLCLVKKDYINYYYNNIYGCGNCKYRGYCLKYRIRDCYRTKQYINWKDKCWKKRVFKYLEENA